MTETTIDPAGVQQVNEVRLVGRVSAAPAHRVLPSGDELWTFRLVIDRTAPKARTPGGDQPRARVDALECAAWTGRVRRSVASWAPGDLVEVTGALRRRFFRTAGGAASRVEVEVGSAKMLKRAAR